MFLCFGIFWYNFYILKLCVIIFHSLLFTSEMFVRLERRWSVICLVDFLEYFRLQFAWNASAYWSNWEELHNEDCWNLCVRKSKLCVHSSTYSAVCLRHEGKTIILQKLLSTMAYISAPGYNKHTLIVCLLGRVAPTSLKSSLS